MFSSSTATHASDSDSPHAAARGERPSGLGETSLLDPVTIFSTIWSFRWLIVATSILGVVLAVLLALATPKHYTATTQVLVDPRDIKVVQNEVTPNGLPSEATLALIESQIAVIYSNQLLDRVIEARDLTQDPEFNGKGDSLLAAIFDGLPDFGAMLGLPSAETEEGADRTRLLTLANLRKAMNVYRDTKSFVINIAVTTEDADKSAELSRAISAAFVDQMGRVQSDTARRASDALSSRLAELRETVSDAERAVEEYKSQNRIVGVGGQLVDDNYISRVNDELSRGRADLTALRVKAEQMRNASVDDVVQGSFPEALASEALTRLRSSYAELEQQNSVLATTLGPRHPQLIASNEAVASARGAIRSELNRIVAATQTELARAESTNRDLTAQLDELKNKQISTSESFVRLRELEREVDASRAVYEAFLLRARETGEQEGINTANVRVISEATPPLEPSSLSRRTVVAAGGILGFLVGIAIAVFVAIARLFSGVSRQREFSALAAAPDGPPARWQGADSTALAAFDGGRSNGGRYGPGAAVAVSAPKRLETRRLRRSGDVDQGDTIEAPGPADETGLAGSTTTEDTSSSETPTALQETDPATTADDAGETLARADQADQADDAASVDAPAADRIRALGDETPRSTLRDRVRAIAAERHATGVPAEDAPQVEKLQSDIAAVKAQIAAIRERRKNS